MPKKVSKGNDNMKFVSKNNYVRDRYSQLCNIKSFKSNVSEKIYIRIRYILGVLIASIYAFMVGYSMYYWKADGLKELFVEFLTFSCIFIVFIYIMQVLRDIIQSTLLPKANNEATICIFNKFYCLSTLQYELKVKKNEFIIALLTPFILFSFLPMIIVFLGIENKVLLAISYANAVLAISDIVQAIYVNKYAKKDSQIDLKICCEDNLDVLNKNDSTTHNLKDNHTASDTLDISQTNNNCYMEKKVTTDINDNTSVYTKKLINPSVTKPSSDDELIIAVTNMTNKSTDKQSYSKNEINESTMSNTIIIEELKELIAPLNENELSAIVKELKK